MAFPKLLQKLFSNNGGGSTLRSNILPDATDDEKGALKKTDVVLTSSQTLEAATQAVVRQNIGAVSSADYDDDKTEQTQSIQNVIPFGVIDLTTTEWYRRPSLPTVAKRSVTLPAGMYVTIGETTYKTTQSSTVNINDFGNVAGGDFYIYACAPQSGDQPTFVISQNSTAPNGYDAQNSRKIGGFHTLCADVGTIEDHPLSGYVTGDILPASMWDLWHRPKGLTEGMVYLGEEYDCDVWVGIYLASWDGENLVSQYGGTIADGASTKNWHGEAMAEQFNLQKMRLPWRHEMVWAARGTPEQVNIKGSADPTTTGGHVATNDVRMISNIGCEDAAGVMWQWLMNLGFAGGSGWTNSVYSNQVDPRSYGQTYGNLYRLLAGGLWDAGSSCGSRSASCYSVSARVHATCGGRGASEPLNAFALRSTGYPL